MCDYSIRRLDAWLIFISTSGLDAVDINKI